MNPNEQYTIEHRRYYDGESDTTEFFNLKIGAAVSYQFCVRGYDRDGGCEFEVAEYKDNDYEDEYAHYKFDDYNEMCGFILATASEVAFSCPSF